jgi:hypothetical protein
MGNNDKWGVVPDFSKPASPEYAYLRGQRTSPDDARRVNANIVGNFLLSSRPDDERRYTQGEPGDF